MYKLKYYLLDKEERKKLKENFYKTTAGNNIRYRLNRLLIIGILGIILGIYLIFTQSNIWELLISIFLILSSLFFLISSLKLKIIKLNNYLIQKK